MAPTMTADTRKVLAFAGSLRRGSFNHGLIRAAIEVAPDGMEIREFDLAPIPLYDFDTEQRGDPAPVLEFKRAIDAADALLIATPEYQHGIPGVLKNALDWASRPPGDSVMQGKVVAIMGASPGFTGTARAQIQLRQTLSFNQTHTLANPEVLVGAAHEKFDAEGRLTDQSTRDYIRRLLDALAGLTRRLQRAEVASV